jgi:hypothetical protein
MSIPVNVNEIHVVSIPYDIPISHKVILEKQRSGESVREYHQTIIILILVMLFISGQPLQIYLRVV